jgi:hypothetical protein
MGIGIVRESMAAHSIEAAIAPLPGFESLYAGPGCGLRPVSRSTIRRKNAIVYIISALMKKAAITMARDIEIPTALWILGPTIDLRTCPPSS